MDNLIIRKVTLSDVEQLQLIGRQTFHETFAPVNSEANMRQYLEEGFASDKLTAELNNPQSEFYFVLSDTTIAGYLKLNRGQAQTELKEQAGLEIERIYVLKAFHGKQVGQALYEKAMEVAGALHVEYVWLGVWEENNRAIGFYRKNGFEPFGQHLFRLGADVQTDILMKKTLIQKS